MAHNTTKVRLLLGSAILWLLLQGCDHTRPVSAPKELMLINVWGWPNVAVAYSLGEDHTLDVVKSVGGKVTAMAINLDQSRFDKLLKTAQSAHAEIRQTGQVKGVSDGANIKIVLDGNTNSTAILMNYSTRFYSLEGLESLFKMLHELVPESYWRVYPNGDQ